MITLVLLASGFGNSYALGWVGSPVLHLRLLLLTLSASDKVKKVLGPRASLDWACFLMLLLHILCLFLSESSVLEGGSENPLFTLGLAVSLSFCIGLTYRASSLSRRLEGQTKSIRFLVKTPASLRSSPPLSLCR